MPEIDGGFLLLVFVATVIMYVAQHIWKNRQQFFCKDNSPLQQAKDAWCKTKPGSKRRMKCEKEWDALAIQEMGKSKSYSALVSAHTRAMTYIHYGTSKKRISEEVNEFFDKKNNEIIQNNLEKEIRRAEWLQDFKKRHPAARPKKISHNSGNSHFCSH